MLHASLRLALAPLVLSTFASLAAAQCGEQHELMQVPTPTSSGQFGAVLDATEAHVVVGGSNSAAIVVYNANSLVQLASFNGPTTTFSGFGKAFDAQGSSLLVGAPDENISGIDYTGRAYHYDLSTYSYVSELVPALPMATLRVFGRVVAMYGDLALVSCEEDGPSQRIGVVRAFSLSPTPTQVMQFDGTDTIFGGKLAVSDDYIAIGATQRVFLYDATSFAPIGEVDLSPYPGGTTSIVLMEDRVYVGKSNKAYVFDVHTQVEIGRLNPAYEPTGNGQFAKRIAGNGGTLATGRIAATRPLFGGSYLFDADSYAQVERYVSSGAAGSAPSSQYEPQVALNSTRLYASAAGRVFVYDLDVACELTTFCFGNGSLFVPCLCANESSVGAREGCRNSTGVGASLRASGSTSVVADDLVLHAQQGPVGQPGVFIQGASAISTTFFDGVLCMGNPTERLEFAFFDGAGQLANAASIVGNGSVLPGDTRFYQLWYRDPMISPCGTGANFTNAVRVDWL